MEREVLAKMRTIYASERTALAWIRTGLAVVATALILIKLYQVRLEIKVLAFLSVILGAVMIGYGVYRLYASLRIEKRVENEVESE